MKLTQPDLIGTQVSLNGREVLEPVFIHLEIIHEPLKMIYSKQYRTGLEFVSASRQSKLKLELTPFHKFIRFEWRYDLLVDEAMNFAYVTDFTGDDKTTRLLTVPEARLTSAGIVDGNDWELPINPGWDIRFVGVPNYAGEAELGILCDEIILDEYRKYNRSDASLIETAHGYRSVDRCDLVAPPFPDHEMRMIPRGFLTTDDRYRTFR